MPSAFAENRNSFEQGFKFIWTVKQTTLLNNNKYESFKTYRRFSTT